MTKRTRVRPLGLVIALTALAPAAGCAIADDEPAPSEPVLVAPAATPLEEQALNTCRSLGRTGAIGSPCNDNPVYPAGNGTRFACPCSQAGGKTNNRCTGDSLRDEGTCTCVKNTCAGRVGLVPDGCGGNLQCGA